MASLWEQSWKHPDFPSLQGDEETQTLIIGGGMAGVLCAYFLHRAKVPYLLLEADTVGSGITKDTTAKLTFQHGLIYHRLLRQLGRERAGAYLQANRAALRQYRDLCQTMECDFAEEDAYVYTLDAPQKLEREQAALKALGQTSELAGQSGLPFPVAGALKLPRQARFHPLRFLSALSEGLHIYEHTPVRQLVGATAITEFGKVRAQNIIVATHFPFLNKHGSYFFKLYQQRSYVIALKGAARLDGMYVDEASGGLSFRNAGELLLVGGGGHRTGTPGTGWQSLRDFAARCYPHATEVCHWATQDCMSLDGAPYIGPYSASTSGLYVATGFNKWGMTSSMVSAMILSNLVQGKPSPWAAAFSPSRTLLRPQLAVNGLEAAVGLLTPTAPRCPHMGCALKWNPQERSWDCPCHGSRFTEEGKLLDNPATGGLPR